MRVAGRRDGVAGDGQLAAVGGADADRHDGGAAAADGDFRAGQAAAERAAAEEPHLEAGEGDAALSLADRLAPDLGQLVADLALDGVQEGRRVEEIGDDIQTRAVEELVEAGEVLDGLRFWDVGVVGVDARRGGIGCALGDRRAGFAAGRLGDGRRDKRKRAGDEKGSGEAH